LPIGVVRGDSPGEHICHPITACRPVSERANDSFIVRLASLCCQCLAFSPGSTGGRRLRVQYRSQTSWKSWAGGHRRGREFARGQAPPGRPHHEGLMAGARNLFHVGGSSFAETIGNQIRADKRPLPESCTDGEAISPRHPQNPTKRMFASRQLPLSK
jgi:hypothetical protein